MSPEHVEIFSKGAKLVEFTPGQILFREGQPASAFYLLQSGRIALESYRTARPAEVLQTVGAGDVLGWSWMFAPFSWHFQARAVVPSSAIELNAGYLLATAEQDHDFGYPLMKRISQVLIHRLHATRKQILALQFESALDG